MERRNRYDLESEEARRLRVVAIAETILDGTVGLIEGVRQLSSLSHDVVDNGIADPDFLLFVGIDSETDHLPVGKTRALWDPTALAERDALVRQIEAAERPAVETACRNLILRFRDV